MGGGGKTVQSNKPWEALRGPTKDILNEAGQIHGQGIHQYVPFSPQSETALSGIESRARAGSPGVHASQDMLAGTVRGDYLTPDSNPYLSKYFDAAAGDVQDRINAEFSKAGRYGSRAHAGTTADELSELAARIYAPAYQQERGFQMRAAGMTPELARQDYYDLGRLGAAGAMRESKQLQAQTDPYERIERYARLISGLPGGKVQTSEYQPGAQDFLNTAIQSGVGTAALFSLF